MISGHSKRETQAYSVIKEDILLIHQDSMETMNFNSCNSYLIKLDEKDYAIIDPGCSRRKFNTTLKSNNINYQNIKYIYITHGHSDHIALLDLLYKKNPNIEILIHEQDKKYVEHSNEYFQMLFNIPLMEKETKFKDFIDAINYYTTPNSNQVIKNSFKLIFDVWNVKNRKVNDTFKDGDVLSGDLKVIHAPGHTPGMCMLFRERDNILFSSDIHLSKIEAYVSGNAGNIYQFKESINAVITMVEEGIVKMILSGHGKNPITTDLKRRLLTFLETLTYKENQLIEILQAHGSMNLKDITKETFKLYLERFKKYLTNPDFMETIVIAEASEMMTNLNSLKELERLKKVKQISINNHNSWIRT